ncbi:hypothetical protein C922_03632 [Plasmodium inui San Antonio 1]|uniref:Nrap protein domain-containing protein n=1 Tax=Plasmodium inui San Antonio 1 TaxID=1237626 RepID=W7A3J2_9APIC|nr:hypothetical protein C922_03632 [Plasmodium inui San Antonio 1]EUD65908.1 hypothetical protein C922_03632 [Plasmodium inui San Antonio 1]
MPRTGASEVTFELGVEAPLKDVDEEKLKALAKEQNGSYEDMNLNGDEEGKSLHEVLLGLNYHKKNVTNVALLSHIKDATISFVADLEDELVNCLQDERNEFKEPYARSMKLKRGKILGSYKNNMMLNSHLNIDIGFEYSLDTKLGRKSKYRNLPHYHNLFIVLLKNHFFSKDFFRHLEEQNLSHSVDIRISVKTWLNNSKSILVLTIQKREKHVGNIHVILYPSKKVTSSLLHVYRKCYAGWVERSPSQIEEKTNAGEAKGKKKKNGKNAKNGKAAEKGTEKGTEKEAEKGTEKGTAGRATKSGDITPAEEDQLRKKIKNLCIRRTILKKFLLTECHLIECDNVIKRSVNSVGAYRQAVKLLKLWCLNRRLLNTFSTRDERADGKLKQGGEGSTIGGFFHYTDVNSFALGLICSYVCYEQNLEKCDAFLIFKKTISFLSSMDLCHHVYGYEDGVFSCWQREKGSSSSGQTHGPHIFLINSLYDPFQSIFCSLTELIGEAKKTEYSLRCGKIYDVLAANYDCFSVSYEEEVFFPLLVSNHLHNYNDVVMALRRNLVRGLADRLGEVAVRLVRFCLHEVEGAGGAAGEEHVAEDEGRANGSNGAARTGEEDSCTSIWGSLPQSLFHDVLLTWKRRRGNAADVADAASGGSKRTLLRRKTLIGVSFFLKTNNVMRLMDISKDLYTPEGTSPFKHFWGDKAAIRRFENNTIFEVVQWKKPGTRFATKKRNFSAALAGRLGGALHDGNESETEEEDQNVRNPFFEVLFSQLYEGKAPSVHVQAIKCILRMMRFNEAASLKQGFQERMDSLKSDDAIHMCSGKKVKKKTFFVYLSSPLLVKDAYFSYYESVSSLYNEVKNVLYSLSEKLFTVCNVTTSNDLLKWTDLGYKKNQKKIIDVVVDIKFNSVNYKNAQNFFRIYESAKGIICNKIWSEGKNLFSKVENKNFCVDASSKLVLFRLYIFVSKVIERNLIQVTNLDDVRIEHVDYMNKIKNYIFRPLVSSFVYFYSTKFSSFHLSVKICKLWFMSKGIPCCDELVENVLFYLYTEEFRRHARMKAFFLQKGLPGGSNNTVHAQFLRWSGLYRRIAHRERAEERAYYRALCEREKLPLGGSGTGLSSPSGSEEDDPLVITAPLQKGTTEVRRDSPKAPAYHAKGKKGNNNVHQMGKSKKEDASSGGRAADNLDDPLDAIDGGDEFLDSFSICPKTALTKFLSFLVSYDWKNRPLIMDYDHCLKEEHKIKLINSFHSRRRSKEVKKNFWICSLYDPHCLLISLPHHLFDFILSEANKSLEMVKKLENNFERENWISLFLMERRNYDIILNFHRPERSLSLLKQKIGLAGKAEDVDGGAEGDTTTGGTQPSSNPPSKKKKQQKEEDGEDAKESENLPTLANQKKTTSENNTQTLNHMYRMDEAYDLSYLDDVTKMKARKIGDMLKGLQKHELLLVYKSYFEQFIKNVEEKFSCQITLLYNPLCFKEIMDIQWFRKKIKRKLRKAPEQYEKVSMSWSPKVFITFNPAFISNIVQSELPVEMSQHTGEAHAREANAGGANAGGADQGKSLNSLPSAMNSSLALTNFNALIFYIKSNAWDLLRGVHFPTM